MTDPSAADEQGPTTGTAPLRALFGYLLEHKVVLIVAGALSVLDAALNLAQPVMVNIIIGSVGSGSGLTVEVVALVALVIGSGIVFAAQQYLLGRTAEGVVFGVRKRLISHLLHLPISVYDSRRSGDLVSRVGSDTTLVRGALTGGLVDAMGGTLVFVGALVAMAILDPVLLGVTLVVTGVAVAAVVIASGRIQTLTLATQEALGDLGAGVDRAVSGVRTIRASGATEREVDQLHGRARSAYRFGVRIVGIEALLLPLSGLAVQGTFLAVLGLGGYRVATGATTVADLITFILFLFMMVMPLGQLFSAITTVRTALGALARIHEILDLPTEEADDHPAPAGRHTPVNGRGASVRLEEVSFGYTPDEPVLQQVSLYAPAGSTTAVVGPSGAGKSTLLALLERFYDVDEGTIRLDEIDIRAIPRAELRSRISYVEQSAPVLAGSIRDNLTLAAPQTAEARCWQVLDAMNLRDRIESHPDGLDAQVGDDGAGLSGGERQRLALARALLTDASLLLLDEPTASLDSRNEHALQQAIGSAAQGRTVLIVAHRLATVVGADQIVVLDGGRVQAIGSHRELLASSELYAELARHQLIT